MTRSVNSIIIKSCLYYPVGDPKFVLKRVQKAGGSGFQYFVTFYVTFMGFQTKLYINRKSKAINNNQ